MSNHARALVPIESWAYSSPGQRMAGRLIDVGLMAESLIYYDNILLNVGNQPQFAELLQWFIRQGKFSEFLALVADGTIHLYEYSFVSAPILKDGVYSLWNIQDEAQKIQNTFEKRFLYHSDVQAVVTNSRHRQALYKALRGNVTEVKADSFGSAIENARKDFVDPRRNALIIQAFVDELYKIRRLGHPPDVEATVTEAPGGLAHNVTWNLDLKQLAETAGEQLGFHGGTPFAAGAVSTRLLWSAAEGDCDLYLGQPMSRLVGDKLFETARSPAKTVALVEELKGRVEFPDVRSLVNEGQLGLEDVLKIRDKAKRFRKWLQSEGDRDRDAILAYHNEVAKEAGYIGAARRVISLFGVLGGGAVGGAVGSLMAGPIGGAVGGAAGSAVGYLSDLSAKLGSGWKPVVFGDWMRERIESLLDKHRSN